MHLHSLDRARMQIIQSNLNIYYVHMEYFQRTVQQQLRLIIYALAMDLGT